MLAFAFAFAATARPTSAAVVISEIHYAPSERTVPEEFVELVNHAAAAVDISGWFFSDGIEFTFPQATVLAASERVVVAQDPDVLRARFGAIRAFGPFVGRLDNDGEQLVLRNTGGGREDEVAYGRGFPWPIVGGSAGYSIELLDADLDNDLGGSWRASSPELDDSSTLVASGDNWRYRRGTTEASSPRGGWRVASFDVLGWDLGRTPIGYGEAFLGTQLADMRDGYTSVFLRHEFEVVDRAAISGLTLDVLYDDGFNAWINGVHVAGANVPSNDAAFDATANGALEDLDSNEFALAAPRGYLVDGTNVLAVQVFNASLGGSSDCFIDARLRTSGASGSGPTPALCNSVESPATPPILRQLAHEPRQPAGGQPVLVSIRATDVDGVAAITLEYQVVEPGAYFALEDPEYLTDWTALAMNDSGDAGDETPGDDVWSAIVPGTVQRHRRLVRYRIAATDGDGLTVRVPYGDDPQPNFAWFCYDGEPSWSGAIEPASADANRRRVVEYGAAITGSLPSYFLLTKEASAHDATWFSRYGGDNYLWRGTLVYDGEVYDHIGYRTRGGVWRYAMGKNMWKFDFLRGHSLEARDDFGRAYDTKWDKLNFSAVIQQGDFLHRGEQGLFESTGFRLFNLAGVPAPRTHFAALRIIDDIEEHGPTQYEGDLWGLYLAIEQLDGRFLDEHRLPDGNLYKMEGGTGELNNQGPTAVTDKSDLNSFLSTYQSATPSDDWWRANLELDSYYGYRSIVEAIHHYDIAAGKNYFYYLNPETRRWQVLPWDLDLTWADNMYGSGDEPFNSRLISRDVFRIDYRNRMRELRDLLYNSDQTGQLIDEFAAMVDDPAGGPSMVDVDRSKWDYHPVLADSGLTNPSKAGHGRFYQRGVTRDFPGMVALMKNYVASRGAWIDSNVLADSAIPRRPTVTYTGQPGHPIDGLSFRSSAFSDPQGSGTFAAIRWRIGEVALPGALPFDPSGARPLEIEPIWESGENIAQDRDITIPAGALRAGARYRARVRMRDTSGRSSQWSEPVEFTAGPPSVPFPSQDSLRVTELMFAPPEGDSLEFVEVLNTGSEPLDLRAVRFTTGIEFDFATGAVLDLAAGEYAVIVRNRIDFALRHDTNGMLIAGEFRGRVDNGGERIVLTAGANSTILDFVYDDAWYPLADGLGHSLHVVDAFEARENWSSPAVWAESAEVGGSPGRADGAGPLGGRQLPGDSNQDGLIDVSDPISLLRRLFVDGGLPLPCDGAALDDGGNRFVLDANASGAVGIDDAIYLLIYLFQEGQAPALGVRCLRVDGCPHVCVE